MKPCDECGQPAQAQGRKVALCRVCLVDLHGQLRELCSFTYGQMSTSIAAYAETQWSLDVRR